MGDRLKFSSASTVWTGAFVTCLLPLLGCSLKSDNLSTGTAMETRPGDAGRVGSVSPPDAGNQPPPPVPYPGTGAPVDPTPTMMPAPMGSVDAAATPPPPSSPDASVPDRIDPAPVFNVVEIATWRGAAAGAYSILHDNVCDPATEGGFIHADPELSRRGLRGGFAVVVGACGQGEWPRVRALAAHGHEIVNHSFSFPCLSGNNDCGDLPASNDFDLGDR